jgi:hypothetical protein
VIADRHIPHHERMASHNAFQNPMLALGALECRIKGIDSSRQYFEQYGVTDYTELDLFNDSDLPYDLNYPLSPMSLNKYNTVYNGGTIEHVWNAHQAWVTAISAVRVGGFFLNHSPSFGWREHGIHNTNQKFILSFLELNGFDIIDSWTATNWIKKGREVLHIVAKKRFSPETITIPYDN